MLTAAVDVVIESWGGRDGGLNDPDVVGCTIFVDTDGVRATDFDLDRATADRLNENGRTAARTVLDSWNWDSYLARRTARFGGRAGDPAAGAGSEFSNNRMSRVGTGWVVDGDGDSRSP